MTPPNRSKALEWNNIRHELTGSSDLARIHIPGLEKSEHLVQLTGGHLTEVDEREPQAIPYVQRRGEDNF